MEIECGKNSLKNFDHKGRRDRGGSGQGVEIKGRFLKMRDARAGRMIMESES